MPTTQIDTLCAVLLSGKQLCDRPAVERQLRQLLLEEGANPGVVALIAQGFEFRNFALHLRELLWSQNAKLYVAARDLAMMQCKSRKENSATEGSASSTEKDASSSSEKETASSDGENQASEPVASSSFSDKSTSATSALQSGCVSIPTEESKTRSSSSSLAGEGTVSSHPQNTSETQNTGILMAEPKDPLEAAGAPPAEELSSRVHAHAGANLGAVSGGAQCDAQEFVGMSLQAAIELAKQKDFRVRLASNDGEPYSLEPLPKDKRLLTFEVLEGVVTSAGTN